MRWTRGAAIVAVVAAAGGVARDEARAGNGAVPAPTGTIYFQDLSTLDPAANTILLYAMDGEGANVTPVLRTDRYVRPSHVLHGATDPARWFLTMKTVEDAEIGGNPRRDVYAVRADGAEVRLTSDPAVEYWMPDWVTGENQDYAVVSMLGRRWTSTDPDATVVPATAGMYLLYVAFEGTRDVTFVRGAHDIWGQYGATADPSLAGLFYDSSVADRDSQAYFDSMLGTSPDVAAYVWGPHGHLAVQDLDAARPRIRILIGFHENWSDRWEGQDPSFNPLLRIAFRRLTPASDVGVDTWVVETANLQGSGRLVEASVPLPANASTTRSLACPRLSPDGNYVAYQLERNGKGTTNTILRECVGGLGAKDLTPGVKPAAAGATGMILVEWR